MLDLLYRWAHRLWRPTVDVDGWLFAFVALIAGSLGLSWVVHETAARVAAQLVLFSGMVALTLWRRPAAWVPAPALFAFSALSQWGAVLVHSPGAFGVWQCLALALPVLAAAFWLRHHARETLCPPAWQGGLVGAVELFVWQLPAIAALKLLDAPGMPLALSTLGLALHAQARAVGWLDRVWQTPAEVAERVRPTATEVAHLGLVAAAMLMALIGQLGAMAQAVAGPVALLMLAVWVRAGEGLSHDVRRVLAALSAVVFAYVWIAQWQGSGWSLARHSILLPVLVAAVGVACLFLSARHQQRQAWVVSAVACVLSSLKLLALVGGALFSPLGAALSLLSMGGLFLLAGYLAPMPPAER